MRKIYLLLFMLFIPIIGCSEDIEFIQNEIENLKLEDTARCEDFTLKHKDDNHNSVVNFYITPNGFDMDKLEKRGYYMEIKVTYYVYYKKDYDVLWDIGYKGAPKYDVVIKNTDNYGNQESNLSTTTSSTSRSISIIASIADIKNQRWILSFSTNNTQNIMYFSNIRISYKCYK